MGLGAQDRHRKDGVLGPTRMGVEAQHLGEHATRGRRVLGAEGLSIAVGVGEGRDHQGTPGANDVKEGTQDGADILLAERTRAAGDQYGGAIKHQSDIPVSKGLPTHASV